MDDSDRVRELKETIREYRFKVRSQGLLIKYALQHLPAPCRGRVEAGLFSLTLHTRGESPLEFTFDGETVKE